MKTLVAAETSGYAGTVAGLFLDRYFKNTKQEVRGGDRKKIRWREPSFGFGAKLGPGFGFGFMTRD